MTDLAVLRLRRDARISAMTREADRVAGRNGFERALLKPEIIADVLRRLDDIFLARFALRLVSLMADGAALRRRWWERKRPRLLTGAQAPRLLSFFICNRNGCAPVRRWFFILERRRDEPRADIAWSRATARRGGAGGAALLEGGFFHTSAVCV